MLDGNDDLQSELVAVVAVVLKAPVGWLCGWLVHRVVTHLIPGTLLCDSDTVVGLPARLDPTSPHRSGLVVNPEGARDGCFG